MNAPSPSRSALRPAFTTMELIVTIAIVVVLASLAFSFYRMAKGRANLARATQKIKNIGEAFIGFTTDHGGQLPLEDAPGLGPNDWHAAGKIEAADVWYNALPRSMGAFSVGDLGDNPEQFYDEEYPLFVPGAPYPRGDKKLSKPYFAIAMNSRLQRTDKSGYKDPGTLASILDPVRTVAFLERGMPGDKKIFASQRGFDAGPKANPRAFAARHNQKGLLLFIDGHCAPYQVSDLIERTGKIIYPEGKVIWTRNSDDDPEATPD